MKLWDTLTLKSLPRVWRNVGMALMGVCVGGGAFVLNLSNAASYLSDDPAACINCHVMDPEYASWKHSSHASVASCNDCHVPHDSTARKYWFKASDGMRHSAMFTFRMEPQVMKVKEESRGVIEANCRHCHESVVSQTSLMVPSRHGEGRSCTDCHREVPHGRVHSLSSTPNAAISPSPSSNVAEWMTLQKSMDHN
jgi:cytochrome c nitrite reductase small subunit